MLKKNTPLKKQNIRLFNQKKQAESLCRLPNKSVKPTEGLSIL